MRKDNLLIETHLVELSLVNPILGTMSKIPSRKPSAQAAFGQLFGTQQSGESAATGLRLVDPELIAVAEQARTEFNQDEIVELAESIRDLGENQQGIEGTGILQPLIVSVLGAATGGQFRYQLVAGERRLRASRYLNLRRVPVLILNVRDDAVLPIQLVENIQRANLQPLEEGRALRKLMDNAGLSIRDAARWLGKDKSYVENRLRLISMGADVHEMLTRRPDTIAHARLIDGIQDTELRSTLIHAVVEEGIGEREVRRRIEGVSSMPADGVSLRKDTKKSTPAPKTVNVEEILQLTSPRFSDLRQVLSTRALSKNEREHLRQSLGEWKREIESLENLLR